MTCPVALTWPTWWSYKTQGLWTPGLWAWVFCPACACRRAAWILCRWTFRGTKPAGRICYIRNHNKECQLVFTKPGDMAGLSHWIKHSRQERGDFSPLLIFGDLIVLLYGHWWHMVHICSWQTTHMFFSMAHCLCWWFSRDCFMPIQVLEML